MTDVYNALISRDLQKKRKKWVDCRVTIESSSRMVKVFELQESGLGPEKQLYTGIMDVKMLSKFIDTEEVKLGSLLVCITEKTGDCIISAESTAADLNVHSTASSVPARLKLPQFKQPIKNNHTMGTIVSQDKGTDVIGESAPAHVQRLLHDPEELEVTMKADLAPKKLNSFSSLTTRLYSSPMLTDTLSNRSNGSEKASTHDGNGNTGLNNITVSGSSNQNLLSQPKQPFLQLKLYDQLHRFCMVGESFKNPNDYATHFSAAVWEEIQLSIASNMTSLEGRALTALGYINQKEIQPLIGKNIIGASSSSQKLCKTLLISKTVQRPSIEACTEKVRCAGIAFTNRVEVIVSQPRTEHETDGSWVKLKGTTSCKDRYNDFESDSSVKRSKYNFDSEKRNSDVRNNGIYPDNGSGSGLVDTSSEQVAETKLYFKILDGKHKIPPNGKNVNLL